jgi:hypothetical protein
MNIEDCPAVKAYRVGKAASYIRKAKAILEDMEDMNAKVDGDFRGILEYCSWLAMCYRQKANNKIVKNQILSGTYEDRFKDNDQG